MPRILVNKEFWIISGLVVLAIGLRLPTLGSPLIEDEAISFNRYIDVPWKKLTLSYQDTNQHTLFLLLSKFFIFVFGESETVFRLPSFLVGVLAIPLTYRLGLAIKMPWPSALVSAVLMGVSWPHLKYSLEGRGYGLTIFLVILTTYSAVRLLNGYRWIWGSVLTGAGFCMAIALPSNLFFLVGLAVFTVLAGDLEWKASWLLIEKMFRVSIPFLIMFVLIGIYFLVIYEGLKHGKNLHPLPLDGARIGKITGFLVAPWGFWMYLFFALGAWRLKGANERILFMAVILVPIVLTLGTGVVGFARTYVYWLPFVLFLAAYGMTEIFLWLREKMGIPIYGLGLGFIFLLAFFPAKQMPKHYAARNNGSLVVAGPNATFSEASQMAMWVEKNIPEDNLVVISTGGPESSVLNRYMGKTVLERMTYFARGGELKKIIFIAHKDMPPEKYPFVPLVKERMLKLPVSKFNKIHSFGNLGVYELDLKIERFLPPKFNPDYEKTIGDSKIPQVNVRQTEEPRVVGQQALYIENNSGKPIDIISPIVKGADISEDHAYLLYAFMAIFKPSSEQVFVHLAEKTNWPPTIGYLNPKLGMFRPKGSEDVWHIHYSLSPLSKGRHYFQERIGIQKDGNYFDGLQAYLLTG
jgi:hypothetical protein